jgi:hypothetical protein
MDWPPYIIDLKKIDLETWHVRLSDFSPAGNF